MGEAWNVVAHDTAMAVYADRAALHYGREVAIFSLCNKFGSGKKLEINNVRVGVSGVLAFTGILVNFSVFRVMGIVTGPLEVRPTPMSDSNERLPTQIRAYYAYGTSPLTLLPSAEIGNSRADEWQRIRRIMACWDEPVNAAYAATTMDEVAGWMNWLSDCVEYTKMKATDMQKIVLRPGESLVLAVDATSADGAVRADVKVEFEVSAA